MNRRFAPSGCSRRAVHASGLAIGEGPNFNIDIRQIDRNAMRVTVFRFHGIGRYLGFDHAHESILEKQFVGAGHDCQGIQVVLSHRKGRAV